jgi:hypothetical protein
VVEENCIAYSVIVGSMKERDHLEDVGVDWRIILKSLLKEYDEGQELDLSDSGQKEVPDSCDNGNEISGYIKRKEISWLAEKLLVSQGTCSMDYLVNAALYKDVGGRHSVCL